MLLEIAIADAYGAGFEFSSLDKVKSHNNLSTYCNHDLYGFKAKYTDDMQMTIAIAEVLISKSNYTSELIADKFVECFNRDRRLGYSKGFYKLLTRVKSGRDLMVQIRPNSSRNGAAMRSVPIGFFKDKSQLLEFATLQSKITHNTDIAIQSSCAIALASHFGVRKKGKIADLKAFLEKENYSRWDFNWSGPVSVSAYDTVSAVFSCLIKNNNLKDLLYNCVDLSGDTDSVASIAIGLACCFDEYDKNLPSSLFLKLDELQYGADFLNKLEVKLHDRFEL